ncbi:PKD domain-containing protein [Cellulophaga tyrosinoxydans]|uniref:PKD domain-containing protein n=1 Tax=Cellulophaga tyrosinoxydans TaxID=504486 RepID=A0A1W1ZQD2_9FLAO|nr:PKD domain-containing protein [Cellulophaga tyrosinoxydans]SMC50308.1 PKD domain-containing protein [Cellulophaga tyrosinoxydans]
MRPYLPIIFFLLVCTLVSAQHKPVTDSIVRYANIGYDKNGNEVSFISDTPPLQQIAGAPKAYYSYFWEFGDGRYSLEKDPKHVYAKKGEYEVKLWATNNYDTGKPPASRPKKVAVNSIDFKVDDLASMVDDFALKRNREPMIDEEMVMIVSYKNPHNYVTSGEIYLYYNERIYKDNNFLEPEIRMYNGESLINNDVIALQETENPTDGFLASTLQNELRITQQVQDTTKKTNLPLSIEKAKEKYKSSKVISFNQMQPGEERNVFLSMRTAPEMIKDTSAIIAVRGIYVSDKNYTDHSVKEMEMEIVTSHDPNKMSSNGVFINYRLARFKRLKYKIKFQNNGEGPARTIRLETDIPEMLDMSTLQVEEMYPECPICPKEPVIYSCLDTTLQKNKAIFTFKNIYLPGSEQKNVMEYDSTKGFVKYSIKFAKDFHKKKTKSRTAIIFDKNEPIITNYATTRFLPGISIGIKAGYNYYPDIEEAKSYFVSAVVSPYKPYRFYLQGEWSNSLNNFTTNTVLDQIIDNSRGVKSLQRTITSNEQKSVNWEVPILLRYNLNNYVGLGVGLQGNFNLTEKNNSTITVEDYENETDQFLINSTSTETSTSDSFTNLKTGLVLDGTLGFARLGPSIGARYVINTKANYNYWQLYAIFRF